MGEQTDVCVCIVLICHVLFLLVAVRNITVNVLKSLKNKILIEKKRKKKTTTKNIIKKKTKKKEKKKVEGK